MTVLAPTIIGVPVDFSNTFVSAFFSLDNARSIGRISDILAQSSSYIGGAGSFLGQVIQVAVGLFTDFFFALFVLGSLIRQVVFMGLVVITPLACFCLIVPRWSQQFNRYVRCLLVVIFLPAVMAFVLKIGISLNPIVAAANGANPTTVGGVMGLVGLLLIMITLWALSKVMRLSAGIATGSAQFQRSLTGRAMGRLGEMATAASLAGGD